MRQPACTDLEANPKLGASWEGFALEQVLSLTGDRDAYFWATHGGAELDLLVNWGGRKYGFEFKYGDAPTRKGLLLLDGPGHDGEVTTGQVAAGAQIVCFPTGRGTPSGFPGVPVIKITGNPRTYERMKENIDINAGVVISGEKSLQDMGEEIYQEILAVASGKLSKAEVLGHDEQFCITRMP